MSDPIDLGISTATGYGVDPYAGQQDGTVFNFGANDTGSTAAAQTSSPTNPVTPTATTAVASPSGSGLLASLTASQWGLVLIGAAIGIYVWLKFLRKK